MLTSLHIENFKSWKNTGEVHLAPITGLFGSNSSGKTSILQLLLLLKQTVESTDRAQVLNLGDDRSLVNLGTFREIIHGHPTVRSDSPPTDASVDWSINWTLPVRLDVNNPENPTERLFSTNALRFNVRISEAGRPASARPVVDLFTYESVDKGSNSVGPRFGMKRKTPSIEQYDLVTDGFEPRRPRGRPPRLPAPVKCYGFPDQVFGYYQNTGFLADLQLSFEELFSRVYYLGPLRDYPRRQYTWAGGRPSDMGRRGERVIDALLASREQRPRIRRPGKRRLVTVEEVVADWLKRLGLIFSFRVEPVATGSNLYQVYVRRTQDAADVLVTDVGFGVSQILPVLAICYYVPEGSVIILEQPEIHLHPSVQAGLADVFIDAVRTRRVQIILESHSEHLLTRLQRRIAEEALMPREAALYFCAMHDDASEITSLNIDLYGNITNWPQDFFGDELGERAAMMEAAIRRQMDQDRGR